MEKVAIVIVVAAADNDVIGRAGGLPWRLKSDMKHFRTLTIGKPVVMGRKTFQSLKAPLKERTNIIVTRDRSFAAPGALVVHDLAAALEAARADARGRGTNAAMVIGGADIYAQALPLADRIELTRVHISPQGDTRLPSFDHGGWHEISRSEHPAGPDDEAAFTILTYERNEPRSAGV